mgnify:CR=1 FL=1
MTSYVMAVVTPPERPAAASITSVPRSLAAALSPALAGALFAAGHSNTSAQAMTVDGITALPQVTLVPLDLHWHKGRAKLNIGLIGMGLARLKARKTK